jgi:hypothetical protein
VSESKKELRASSEIGCPIKDNFLIDPRNFAFPNFLKPLSVIPVPSSSNPEIRFIFAIPFDY